MVVDLVYEGLYLGFDDGFGLGDCSLVVFDVVLDY